MKKISCTLAVGLLILTACASAAPTGTSVLPSTIPPQPTATTVKAFPTFASPGNSVVWDDLQVTMDRLEITQDYITDYGSSRLPPAGQKFLWIHIRLENTAQTEIEVPLSEHYSILYVGTELKPSYGHRQGYSEYTTLGPTIFPDQHLDGWIRFDIPTAAELRDLRFVFLPESCQVGASYTSPNYPYADDKPTYVWNCGP